MKRYETLQIEDEEGKIYNIKIKEGLSLAFSEGTNGALKIKFVKALEEKHALPEKMLLSSLPKISAGEYAETLSVYTDNYGNKAIIPPDFVVSGYVKENTIWGRNVGLVIYYKIPKEKVSKINWRSSKILEYLKMTFDQFVWTPVDLLPANATLDGVNFNEKFGRIYNFQGDVFSNDEYNEPLEGELALQKASIDKYGGYFTSRYDISKDPKTGRYRSVKGQMPLQNVTQPMATKIASSMLATEVVTSHLPYGAEYDTNERWMIASGSLTTEDIAVDSTSYGNYLNTKGSFGTVLKTGSNEEWCINNFYDFTGNVFERTQERNGSSNYVVRGGSCNIVGSKHPTHHRFCNFHNANSKYVGHRVVLCIK